MKMRERRLAQIVRDFMDAFALARSLGEGLRMGSLDFATVKQLVGDAEDNVLFRLKEECHALFRNTDARPRVEVQAEELFDLAVGALFHETMKLREGYYLTTSYGPRLRRMMTEGSATGPLAESFERVFVAGRRRMTESEAETATLFNETRDQLLIVLHQVPASGAVARSLVEKPSRTELVFEMPLRTLLADVYGTPERGFQLAIQSLMANGHFAQAREVLERPEVADAGVYPLAIEYARGMEAYYAGESYDAVECLARWVSEGTKRPDAWSVRAADILCKVALNTEALDPKLAADAVALAESLKQARAS